jgi:glycosyltransferase involved in cell wall biosynthesis
LVGHLKILFVCPYTPTLIRTRAHHLITTLVRRGHNITLATLWQSEGERSQLQSFADQGVKVLASRLTRTRSAANLLAAFFTNRPLQARYCWAPALAEQLQKTLAPTSPAFDIVHVEHLRAVEYGLFVQQQLRHERRIPVLWDSVDCISMLFEEAIRHSRTGFGRWVTRFELPATRRYEGWAVSQFDQVLVTSKVDRAALEQLAQAVAGQARRPAPRQPQPKPIEVLPNGVDLVRFKPPAGPREPATVVLSGKMSYHANVTAAHQLVGSIMPIVWASCPTVKVMLVGSTPTPDVRALANRYAPLVTVTGHVPDIRSYLQSATLAVAPMTYGAGIQNKVLEAMACATPLVASPPAIAAFPESVRQALLVAGDDQSSAAAILSLLSNPTLRASLGARGRAYVSEHFDWWMVTGELETIYNGLLS